jgi:hypothetical protein
MPPTWLTVLAWVSLLVAVGCAAAIVADIYVRGHRQQMGVMEAVWPITALYAGPVALWAYRRFGLPNSPRWQEVTREEADYDKPVSVGIGVGHCGAGCTLGDIAGAWVVFALALKVAGLALYAEYLVNFSIAFVLGIAFQYAAIKPARDLSPGAGVSAALKADTLSLVAFEVGVFGFMAVIQLVLFPDPHLTPDRAAYWFLMQIAMLLGFVTSYPANVWLVRRGIKEAM